MDRVQRFDRASLVRPLLTARVFLIPSITILKVVGWKLSHLSTSEGEVIIA